MEKEYKNIIKKLSLLRNVTPSDSFKQRLTLKFDPLGSSRVDSHNFVFRYAIYIIFCMLVFGGGVVVAANKLNSSLSLFPEKVLEKINPSGDNIEIDSSQNNIDSFSHVEQKQNQEDVPRESSSNNSQTILEMGEIVEPNLIVTPTPGNSLLDINLGEILPIVGSPTPSPSPSPESSRILNLDVDINNLL